MAQRKRLHDIDIEPANPPIDERRREQLRSDARVVFYERPDRDHRWSYDPSLRVEQPVSPRELIGHDDEDDDE